MVFRGAARHGAVSGQSEQRSLAASFPLEAPRGIQHATVAAPAMGETAMARKKKKKAPKTQRGVEKKKAHAKMTEREEDRNRESMREREGERASAINLKHDAGAPTKDACWVSLQAREHDGKTERRECEEPHREECRPSHAGSEGREPG